MLVNDAIRRNIGRGGKQKKVKPEDYFNATVIRKDAGEKAWPVAANGRKP